MPQDRLRKLTDENIELARNLKKEMDLVTKRTASKPITASSKKKAAGSDLSSTRGSEERHSSVPATGRGQKRGRDFEIEKVGDAFSPLGASPAAGGRSFLDFSRESSPDLPGFPSPPPSKRLRRTPSPVHNSAESGNDKPARENLSPEHGAASLAHFPPPLSPFSPPPPSSPLRGNSTSLSSAQLSPAKRPQKALAAVGGLRRGRSGGLPKPDEAPALEPWRATKPTRASYNAKPVYQTGGLVNQMRLEPEWAAPKYNPWVEDNHPKIHWLNANDAGNRPKRNFYRDTDPNQVLMIAGVPLDESLGLGPSKVPPVEAAPYLAPSNAPVDPSTEETRPGNSPVNLTPSQEEAFHSRPSVRIVVPDHLKSILVDDWENVTKNLSLVPLPSAHPVNEIMNTYFEEEKGKRRLGSAEADLLEEVVAGVKEYFDKCLGRILLYRFEREQYFEIRQLWEAATGEWEGKGAGDVYGAEHLCRLFGKPCLPLFLHNLPHAIPSLFSHHSNKPKP